MAPDAAQDRLAADAEAAGVPLVDHAHAVILAAVEAAETLSRSDAGDDTGL